MVTSTVKENVSVPKGVDNNMNLRVSKKGHNSQSNIPGDLIINVQVKPHHYFKRENFDIHTDLFISLSQAVLGSDIVVKTLYGDVKIKLESGI